MANILKREKQVLCLKMLCEGASIRSVERTVGAHRDTVTRLLVRVGSRCADMLDRRLRRLKLRHIQLDEQWTWVLKKQRELSDEDRMSQDMGDQYLFIAFDTDTKLIASHLIGKRNEENTQLFIKDLASRLILPPDVDAPAIEKPQISTDGWLAYPPAILGTFESLVRYGILVKNYRNESTARHATPEVTSTERRPVQLIDNAKTICTSHVERFNCTTRQFVKRFCRLTLAFSKKLENLKAAVALHIAYYNFVWRTRLPGNTSKKRPTAAMMAGVTNFLWTFENLFDAVADEQIRR